MRTSIKSLMRSKWMPFGAGLLGFLEGSFVFLPIEPLAIPAMIAQRMRAWTVALYILAGNVLGATLMYALGVWLLEPVIQPFVSFVGAGDEFGQEKAALAEDGFLTLFLIGVTPIPFQVGTAAAGAAAIAFPLFIAAVSLSRGLRYMALAGLVMIVGARAEGFLERHETSILIAGAVLFIIFGAIVVLG